MPQTRVLFVCMGNICRSPMAEAVFNQLLADRGLTEHYEVDSAGTGAWHAGELADPRTRATLTQHAIPYNGRARQVRLFDFDHFDHIIAMDHDIRQNLLRLDPSADSKITLLLDWDPNARTQEVPDPYYGGPDGFKHIYTLITNACTELLNQLEAERDISS